MKKLLILLVSLSLYLAHIPSADAGKGFSSGGSRGASSGRSSSSAGRSYSSGSKSYSSGSKSYSSGNTSYSSGGKSYSSTSKSYTSSSGKNYSSGGSAGTSFSPPTAKNTTPGGSATKTSYSSPSGRSYSAGGSNRSGTNAPVVRPPSSRQPAVSYDKLAAAEQKKAESRAAYVQAQQPLKTYTPPKGDPKPIDPKDRQIEQLRADLDHQRWVNRQPREQTFYGAYYTRPLVVYNDPYSSFFWWWLLDRSLDQRAYWAYNHRYDMDDARYQALLARDAQLQARIKQLEDQSVPRDRTYAPPELKDNPDLMYSDDYVNAVYNPQPAPVAAPAGTFTSANYSGGFPRSYSGGGGGGSGGTALGRALFTMFLILLIAGFIWLGVWLVFCKRWNI